MRADQASLRAAGAKHLKLDINKPLFVSPPSAGRKITAGFSYLQRIGKSASIDVWFPKVLQDELNKWIASGQKLGAENFPAEWAAVRQFELLQEAGNYKIYDLKATHLTRTLEDLTRNMRGGGYRVTVATIGGYVDEDNKDELEILDKRLQKRIASLIHMLYMEEQSESINQKSDAILKAGQWDYQTALPHIGVTLGARNLFRPVDGGLRMRRETVLVPGKPHQIIIKGWHSDAGVKNEYDQPLRCVSHSPKDGEYAVACGIYHFSPMQAGCEVTLSYFTRGAGDDAPRKLNGAETKHKLAQHFFDVLNLLPQNHIVHDTAVGLQLPEMINEEEWIYLVDPEDTAFAFNQLMSNLFAPFDKFSLSGLHERADAKSEVKATTEHMRSYGDRLTPEADKFYRDLAALTPQ